jgi:hypothetical protein
MADIFERLSAGRPPPLEEASRRPPLIERLLDWLVNHWTKDTVTAREIYIYGPNPIQKDKKTAFSLAQILVERGWLVPIETHRRDRREWRIIRRSLAFTTNRTKSTTLPTAVAPK